MRRDNPRPDCSPQRCSATPLGQLHFGQGAGQADRDQPQRHHPAGSAGAAAARRRAADQPEPAGLPAARSHEEAGPSRGVAMLAAPAAAQTPAVERRARGRAPSASATTAISASPAAASAAVRSQVATINIQRRSLYSNLAASKGVSPQDVGITAGCQLLARVGVGEAYMLADGVWRRRGAGQAVAGSRLLPLSLERGAVFRPQSRPSAGR